MEVSSEYWWILLGLLAIFECICVSSARETGDNSAHGIRFAGNNRYFIIALNSDQNYLAFIPPYNSSRFASMKYIWQDLYVYSLDIIPQQENSTSYDIDFIQVSVNMTDQTVHLAIVHLFLYRNGLMQWKNCITYDDILPTAYDYMFVKMHPTYNIAFLFAGMFVVSYNLVTHQMTYYMNEQTRIMDSVFYIHAADLADSYAILVGFYADPTRRQLSTYMAIHLSLYLPTAIYILFLNDGTLYYTEQVLRYDRANDISVAVNPTRGMAIIGIPAVNKVFLLNITENDPTSRAWTMHISRTEFASQYETGFGRSITWIDENTVAIAILNVPNQPWSQSEIRVFDIDKPFQIPLLVFPNNHQQIVQKALPLFLQIYHWSGNLFILTDSGYNILLPSQPPGFFSTSDNKDYWYVSVYGADMCVPGTYKNTWGFGPCTVCPSQTKNPGNEPCTICKPCAAGSYCPLAAIGDVLLADYPSYTETFSYPSSPEMDNYDDLLVQHIFSIGQSSRCLVISPIFWVINIVALCFVIWLLIMLPKVCQCRRGESHRNRVKRFLKKTDLINDGEKWVGGLFSFAIIALFGFTFWFASEFLDLYPIETSTMSYASCDQTLRNAIFESSLQLPLPNRGRDRWTIFDILDSQTFTITVDLLNTKADCSQITVQQNRPGVNYLKISIASCLLQVDNATRSISFQLPAHRTDIQVNITGAVFISGMRLCFHGSSRKIDDVNKLESFNECQLFEIVNETLARITHIHVMLIKVINITKPLEIGKETLYNGRWALSFAENSLSDELIYKEHGDYLRYLAPRTVISMTLSEQPFYLQNNQQPIVRKPELAFHTLLFSTLIIELFGMAFVLFRLLIIPIIRIIHRKCFEKKENNDNQPDISTAVTNPEHTIIHISDQFMN